MRTVVAALLFCCIPGLAFADAGVDSATQKTLKGLINAIRYGKDDIAAKQIDFGAMAKGLMADDWAKLPAADQSEMQKHLETLVRGLSFPKGKDMFQYLDAMLYESARVEGDTAKVKSTVVVHRDLKKTEIVIDWVLVKSGGSWKVLDTVMLGESTITGLREQQVKPFVAKGGPGAVLQAMRDKVAEIKKS